MFWTGKKRAVAAAPEQAPTVGNVLEVTDLATLPEALQTMLHSEVDIVVARDLVSSPSARSEIEDAGDRGNSLEAFQLLYQAAPVLIEVDPVAQNFWETHGYDDYAIGMGGLVLSHVARGSIVLHRDYSPRQVNPLQGPLTLSLGLSGRATYYAEKPSQTFRAADGEFDVIEWMKWRNNPVMPTLLSSCSQGQGDGIWIVNHPQQTYHQVMTDEESERSAAIFDYIVRTEV